MSTAASRLLLPSSSPLARLRTPPCGVPPALHTSKRHSRRSLQCLAAAIDLDWATCESWLQSLDNSPYYLQQQQQRQRQQLYAPSEGSTTIRRKRNGTRWAVLRAPERSAAARPAQPEQPAQPDKPKRRPNHLDIGGSDWLAFTEAAAPRQPLTPATQPTPTRSRSEHAPPRQRRTLATELNGRRGKHNRTPPYNHHHQHTAPTQHEATPAAAAASSATITSRGQQQRSASPPPTMLPTEASLTTLLRAANAVKDRRMRPLVVIPKNIVDIGAVGWVEPGAEVAGSHTQQQRRRRRRRAAAAKAQQADVGLRRDISNFVQDLQRFLLGRS